MKDLNSYWKQRLSGKRVLITGGSTGIGREVTILLATLGAKCMICGRNQEQIDETIAETKKVYPESYCIGLAVDLANKEGIEQLFTTLDRELGGIDVLVNNAAIGSGSILDGVYAEWKYSIDTNLLSYLACCHEAAKRMEVDGKGHIVNIGSMSADVRGEGSSIYVAAKAGIQGFSEALRKEINPKGVKVTLLEPGAVDTDMQEGEAAEKLTKIEKQEMLKAEDIAIAVAFCLVQPDRSEVISLQIRPHLQLI
ncbi:SDR family NAD(P)-dependent oxidoreductase [Pedobacter chinensis]|uniref:SDR family NAD(P)-dependent oxidoreductase n=1 Tax=Pedobacter chinensis TaxID=2282421 RepID=A0A369Q528_9SPHI|nr:SDR family oxidoreductase [Pedobacter chinensis]RDC58029.1 SDR family NAD(P)-dependent oxidoreductase [Pedobacter chinensis]